MKQNLLKIWKIIRDLCENKSWADINWTKIRNRDGDGFELIKDLSINLLEVDLYKRAKNYF
jgi:hypothetical protein